MPPRSAICSAAASSRTGTQSQSTLPGGVRTSSARWPIATAGVTPTPTRSGSSSRNSLRGSRRRSSRVVQRCPSHPTYWRSSRQIGQSRGGRSVSGYCTAQVAQIQAGIRPSFRRGAEVPVESVALTAPAPGGWLAASVDGSEGSRWNSGAVPPLSPGSEPRDGHSWLQGEGRGERRSGSQDISAVDPSGPGRGHPRKTVPMPEAQPVVVPDDGLTTRQRRQRPLLAVHTGEMKGKSTAAFGMALRAWNAGLPVAVYQFVKSGKWRVGEEQALRALGDVHARTGQGAPVQ